MKAVIQRVNWAKVHVDGECKGAIEKGLLVLLGVHRNDEDKDLEMMLDRILKMRIFSDNDGRMNDSIRDAEGGILVISQFTLFGRMKKGTRPGFSESAGKEKAIAYYEKFLSRLREEFNGLVQEGVFAADMKVSLENDGPVTISLDTFQL